ncbi:MAG: CBS domain-containing protein [Dehalococcoidia bacterium]
MPKVSEIMQRNVLSVKPTTSLLEVARQMSNGRTEMITVCDNGKYKGIITRDDIISSIASDNGSPKRQSAATLMHNGLPRISPGTDIIDAAKIMAKHGSQQMPVVQNGKLFGILTLDDLLYESPALAVIVMTRQSDAKFKKAPELVRVP